MERKDTRKKLMHGLLITHLQSIPSFVCSPCGVIVMPQRTGDAVYSGSDFFGIVVTVIS